MTPLLQGAALVSATWLPSLKKGDLLLALDKNLPPIVCRQDCSLCNLCAECRFASQYFGRPIYVGPTIGVPQCLISQQLAQH